MYLNKAANAYALDISFAGKLIPNIIIKHLTWTDPKVCKAKIAYQNLRWSPPKGFGCSFKWNDEKNCLEFNEEYYKLTGQRKPTVYEEN